MGLLLQISLFILLMILSHSLSQLEEFVSIDCGGATNYTDPITGIPWVSDSGMMPNGKPVNLQNQNGGSAQYRTRRDFPVDSNKYCYTLSVQQRRRYVVRATFKYVDSLGTEECSYPKFQLYLDATKWTTVTIYDVSRVYMKEMIVRAQSDSVDVCLCCATTGAPFISTLELRPLNLSMYATDFEDGFFLEVATRVNFGAETNETVRYPDDPYDRIWESDLAKRQNFLVGVASGTERINTSRNIDISTREHPPNKVMQTAVVGTKDLLSYRLNLDDFPANARAYAYFAEIEDLGPNETRKFQLVEPNLGEYNKAIVNIMENANGAYTLYEPSYMNVSLEFVLSFAFRKAPDSTRGPLLNAIEISRYVEIAQKTDSRDLTVLNSFLAMSGGSTLPANGDPCLPVAWEWVICSSTVPPRVTKIALTEKNINGTIPSSINEMEELTELWLDGNLFMGMIPDMSKLVSLKIVHLENNKLIGHLPSYLGNLQSLHELYVQNNSLSGDIPEAFLRKGFKFEYSGNPNLRRQPRKKVLVRLILGTSIGVLATILVLMVGGLLLLRNTRRRKIQAGKLGKGDSLRVTRKASTTYSSTRAGEEGLSYCISLSIIEEATGYFSRKVGKGSFGTVYYGKMKDGKEVAVKMMGDSSNHGNQQFATEARSSIRRGDAPSIVDPILAGGHKIESIWRIAEVAIQSVELHSTARPRMQDVVLAIQDAIKIEKGAADRGGQKLSPGSSKAQSSRKTLLTSFLEVESPDLSSDCIIPAAR
ncbi:hypothetical protein SAY86_008306 [Trapa natans]|uniref:non-specific serine/threonine protein kinase n=1 Tax=Trapa natans TaxID=22666 RepID=A0AAN7K644_TRANT|nr:hypothetical protein SAY86_008306 [Trapa natans]